jgi:CrcB protein
MTALFVFLGAMVGAPLRYLTDRAVQSWHSSDFPWGTFVVNVVGSVVLGALSGAGSALPSPVLALAGTGFCGALTTYSTFSYETLKLAEKKAYFQAASYATLSIVVGVGAALLAYLVVGALR